MPLVAPRIVNCVLCVKRIQHKIHFSWQAKYLVKLTLVVPRIVNDVSNVKDQSGIMLCSTEKYWSSTL